LELDEGVVGAVELEQGIGLKWKGREGRDGMCDEFEEVD